MDRRGPTPESVYERNSPFDRFPPELIDWIIEASVFSEPFGSHEALHTLRDIYQEKERSIIKERIPWVFESRLFQKRIESSWKLCHNFDHMKNRRHIFNKDATYDLASWSITNCPPCFTFILDHKAIYASSFCQNGDSFSWIAFEAEQQAKEQAEQQAEPRITDCLVQSMELGDLLKPAFVNGIAILQIATADECWFRPCWERLKSQSDVNLSSLRPIDVQSICRFANIELANELLERGVDLGMPSPTNQVANWYNMLRGKHPGAMLGWLHRRGYQCPGDMLEYALTNNCVKAVPWILSHVENPDWKQGAFIAAKDNDSRSANLLKIIVQHRPNEREVEAVFCQDLLIKIVETACGATRGIHEHLLTHLKDQEYLEYVMSEQEKIAIRKIAVVKCLGKSTGVAGLKVQATNARLPGVVESLEDLERKF